VRDVRTQLADAGAGAAARASSSTNASTSPSPRRRTASTSSRIDSHGAGAPARAGGFLVGRSVHSIDEARAAEAEGADYVIFGTVFPSGSKPRGHRTAGLEALAAVARRSSARPGHRWHLVEHGCSGRRAGAGGVAAIGLFFDAAGPMDDLRGRLIQTVAGLRRAFDRPGPFSHALSQEPQTHGRHAAARMFHPRRRRSRSRLLAAQGALAPRADEQLAILVYLVTHDETHVATVANQTIAALPVEAVAGLLARPDTSEKVLAFFAGPWHRAGEVATEDTDAPLIDTGEEVAVEAEPRR
jgi:hypothetical protein